MNILRRFISSLMSCFGGKKAKTQDIDMAAADGNDVSLLLSKPEVQNNNWSGNLANKTNMPYSPADHRSPIKYEDSRNSVVASQPRNQFQPEKGIIRQMSNPHQFQAQEDTRPQTKHQFPGDDERRRQANNQFPPEEGIIRQMSNPHQFQAQEDTRPQTKHQFPGDDDARRQANNQFQGEEGIIRQMSNPHQFQAQEDTRPQTKHQFPGDDEARRQANDQFPGEEEARRQANNYQFQGEEDTRRLMNGHQQFQGHEETRRQTQSNLPLQNPRDRELQVQPRIDIASLSSQLRLAQDKINQLSASEAKLQNLLRRSEGELNYWSAEMSKAKDSQSKYRPLLRARDDEISLLKNSLARYKSDLGDLEALYSKISESGSYPDNTATPTDASDAFNKLSLAVDSFSKQLSKVISGNLAKLEELHTRYGDVTFLRPSSHFPALPLKAEVMKILFEGFENESFDLEGGYSVHPDPVKRKKEFFALFLEFRNNKRGPGSVSRGEQDDVLFRKYYERSKSKVWQLFSIENSEDNLQALDKAFLKAAQSVWAVHLLSFSFEPPASLFRIRNGTPFDRTYMATPTFLEFHEDSLEKVAFMLTPGLRVDKFSTLKSEIYPVNVDK